MSTDEMSDSEMWREHRKVRAAERAQRRESSTSALKLAEVNFTSHNDGAHLIINHNHKMVDFWPGTGRWKSHLNSRHGFGVKSLLKFIKESS